MADLLIQPSQLQGSLIVPPSKSHTLRAILFAALASGTSRIERVLFSPDTQAMIRAVRLLGAKVSRIDDGLQIIGFAGKPQVPDDVIECGNSGQVLRFIGALAGLIPAYSVLTGDRSIRHNRPAKPLLDGLEQLGAFAVSSRGDGHAPILIKGPFSKNRATIDGRDSQPVSGLMIAAAFAPHPIELYVTDPGEKPWIDLTLHWLKKLNIPYFAKEYSYYRIEGNSQIKGFSFEVPGDFSSAAFPIAAAILTQSTLILHNVDVGDVQGDKAIVAVLQQMGATLSHDHSHRQLKIEKGSSLKGMRIDVNDFIDALPILAVIGCFATGRTEIVNGGIARKKESDRISSIATELKKMGAQIEERPDGLIIEQSELHGAEMDAHRDHRIALSLSVAALSATGPSCIHGIECIKKTYPSFVSDFRAIGAFVR